MTDGMTTAYPAGFFDRYKADAPAHARLGAEGRLDFDGGAEDGTATAARR